MTMDMTYIYSDFESESESDDESEISESDEFSDVKYCYIYFELCIL